MLGSSNNSLASCDFSKDPNPFHMKPASSEKPFQTEHACPNLGQPLYSETVQHSCSHPSEMHPHCGVSPPPLLPAFSMEREQPRTRASLACIPTCSWYSMPMLRVLTRMAIMIPRPKYLLSTIFRKVSQISLQNASTELGSVSGPRVRRCRLWGSQRSLR